MISSKSGHICRIVIFKTVVRLGDSLRGYLDFQGGAVPCYECVIRAETNEFFDESQRRINVDEDLSFVTVPVDISAVHKSKGILCVSLTLFSSQNTGECNKDIMV